MFITGLGAPEKADLKWLAMQDTFANVLASLNTVVATENGEAQIAGMRGGTRVCYEILEIKTPCLFLIAKGTITPDTDKPRGIVSNRALYGRFKKAKDLTLYSEDDLNAILGKKKAKRQGGDEEAGNADAVQVKLDDNACNELVRFDGVTDRMMAFNISFNVFRTKRVV